MLLLSLYIVARGGHDMSEGVRGGCEGPKCLRDFCGKTLKTVGLRGSSVAASALDDA